MGGVQASRRPLTGPTLRERIIEHLQGGPDSISGIARRLAEDGGAPMHRLTVSGYLQALAEAGVLRDLDRPPSRVYQLADPRLHRPLHDRMARAAVEAEPDPARAGALLLAALERLLGRPVFRAELRQAGLKEPPGLEPVQAGERDRRIYRASLQRRLAPPLEVPRGDPLYAWPDPEALHDDVDALIDRVLRDATGSAHLAHGHAAARGRQAALELDGGDA